MLTMLLSTAADVDWVEASQPWLLVGILLAVCVVALCAVLLLRRVEDLDRHAARIDELTEIHAAVQRLAEDQQNLDLRRVEHALLDIRDGQKRMEDRLLQTIEAAKAARAEPVEVIVPAEPSPEVSARLFADRVFGRLIALGYEQVHIITPIEELSDLNEKDGEVLVEARRSGAPCKGRVLIRSGVITDVDLRSVYSTFP